ncbi:FAD-dependent thymidylate synthase [Flavobacteriales bacterium]|nr:FAD-dependent thymidylate synthase [Flavobacteriales bacterium]
MQVTLINSMGTDQTVVDAARVSFAKKAENYTEDQNEKLIGYLARHSHWTPFGHAQATFHIEAPVFVARQLVKHQVGLVWNEVSRRYVDDSPRFFSPPSWRPRAPEKKQGSDKDDQIMNMRQAWKIYESAIHNVSKTYGILLEMGVAPEQARMVLPQSMMTEWYWTGSLAAWSRVCRLRISDDAQVETEKVAQDISREMKHLFPISWAALEKNNG